MKIIIFVQSITKKTCWPFALNCIHNLSIWLLHYPIKPPKLMFNYMQPCRFCAYVTLWERDLIEMLLIAKRRIFEIRIKWFKFKNIQTITSFKVLSYVILYIPLDLRNKILTAKLKWRGFNSIPTISNLQPSYSKGNTLADNSVH